MNWSSFAEKHWEEGPALIAGSPPVDPARAFTLLATSAEPFRTGSRHRVLPAVRFHQGDGRSAAPGDMLPAPGEDLTGYAARVAGPDGWLIEAEQPLFLDWPLWSAVRDLLDGLWREVGAPVAPVVAELTAGDAWSRAPGTGETHAMLTWVLAGRLRTRLGEETLEAGAGDLLYWPAGTVHADEYTEPTLTLRVHVPTDPRMATMHARETLIELMDAGYGDDRVPYVGDGPFPLARTVDLVSGIVDSGELTRLLRLRWAARRSAAGLDPAPAPRPPELPEDCRIRVTGEVLRVRAGNDGVVWAANGHAFTLRGSDAGRILRRLTARGTASTTDFPGAFALLQRLYQVRVIDMED
ncbi:hypothetical protein Afil01_12660 [Actinorhabdospora filicis]|uniref:Cupin domain-containing protein n=1 Tax=Actinorhabdospora filicis TaxID=1785913 RepID=A0A9W6W7D8_9ACTN|nr:hypothetical protein [Actinorhabdospora filicis]GLZ76459.1 hypothetical protein Afil01_12660 [Actinorhabdospora filicis]